MNKLKANILQVEEKLESKLNSFVKACFEGIWLPSHDLQHHQRVWSFAKELLSAYEINGRVFNTEFIESLMIACYFHDVGMIKTIAPEHGAASAKVASEFLTNYTDIEGDRSTELLNAIINHDNKEYLDIDADIQNPTVYTLLTVADDLDAFGALGLYRYIEIYQMRQVDYKLMGKAILTNLNKRFRFVEKVLEVDNQLHRIHLTRYQKGIDFIQLFSAGDFRKLAQLIEMKENVGIYPLKGCLYAFQNAVNEEYKGFNASY